MQADASPRKALALLALAVKKSQGSVDNYAESRVHFEKIDA